MKKVFLQVVRVFIEYWNVLSWLSIWCYLAHILTNWWLLGDKFKNKYPKTVSLITLTNLAIWKCTTWGAFNTARALKFLSSKSIHTKILTHLIIDLLLNNGHTTHATTILHFKIVDQFFLYFKNKFVIQFGLNWRKS